MSLLKSSTEYKTCSPAADEVEGEIIPVANVNELQPTLRREDFWYLLEMCHLYFPCGYSTTWSTGTGGYIYTTPFSSPTTPEDMIKNMNNTLCKVQEGSTISSSWSSLKIKPELSSRIDDVNEYCDWTTDSSKFSNYVSWKALNALDLNMTDYVNECLTSSTDLTTRWKQPNAIGLRGMPLSCYPLQELYYAYQRPCWQIATTYAGYCPDSSYRAGPQQNSTANLIGSPTGNYWNSSINVDPTPTVYTWPLSSAYTNDSPTSFKLYYNASRASVSQQSGITLKICPRYEGSTEKEYLVCQDGPTEDVYAWVDMHKTDLIGAYACCYYSSQGYTSSSNWTYKLVLEPLEHMEGTKWKFKIFDYALMKKLVTDNFGFDWSRVGTYQSSEYLWGTVKTRNFAAPEVSYFVVAYDYQQQAGFRDEIGWTWQP